MSYVLNVDIALEFVECYQCGTVFAIDQNLIRRLRNTGDAFYCPNGHRQSFTNPIERQLKEAQKQLKEAETNLLSARQNEAWWRGQAEERAEDLNQTRKKLSTAKGQLTRTQKRLAAGICPECHRQFVNLHRHMENQHPDFAKESDPPV